PARWRAGSPRRPRPERGSKDVLLERASIATKRPVSSPLRHRPRRPYGDGIRPREERDMTDQTPDHGDHDTGTTGDPHRHADPESEPTTEELDEPSTEKEPEEQPTAPEPAEPEPSHQAVGIGVVDGPQ